MQQYSVENQLFALPQISAKKLTDILDKIPGQKDFIIDSDLIKPLEKVIGVTKLRSHGVDKIYKLDTGGIPSTNIHRVYFIKSDLISAKYISDQINSELSTSQNNRSSNISKTFHVILVPRKLQTIMTLFEEEGIIGFVSVYTYKLESILLDSKVLSDELHSFFKTLFVNGNQSFLPSVARSIWSLQMLFGKPNITILQGKYSQKVYNMVNTYFDNVGEPEKSNPDIGCFMIVDRDIDYTSVLLTPGTYTSLLDDVFGVKCGTVDVKVDSNEVYKINLNEADEIYTQIKNRHFSDVFAFLKSRAESLKEDVQKSRNMNVQQMKSYVMKDLKNVTLLKKLLTYHIGACEAIISEIGPRFENLKEVEHCIINCKNHRDNITYIENCIATDLGSKSDLLRLISLLSLTNDGLTSDEMNQLKTQFLHKYGYKHLSSFNNLQNVGLIYKQPSTRASEVPGKMLANIMVQALPALPLKKSAFYLLSQKLKLFPEITDDYNLKNPTDMSYVYGGSYIPLVCQLISNIIKKEINLEELEKIIPNLSFKYNNSVYSSDIGKHSSYLIYFIGGVTYAEIAAFQLLEKLTGANIYVAGTSIINGNSLIESLL